MKTAAETHRHRGRSELFHHGVAESSGSTRTHRVQRVARRRVAFYGRSYDAGSAKIAQPIPPFLFPLREKIAVWAGVDPETFATALINEYAPGAPIGWHRDAPQYGINATNGRLRAHLTTDGIALDDVHFTGGDGSFTATGLIALPGERGAAPTRSSSARRIPL